MQRGRQSIFILLLLALTLTVYLMWWKSASVNTDHHTAENSQQPSASWPSVNDHAREIEAAVVVQKTPVVAQIQNNLAESDELSDPVAEVLPSPWVVVTESDVVDSSITLSDQVTVAEPVEFRANYLFQAAVGDQVALRLPDGAEYAMQVTSIETVGNNRTWFGMIDLEYGAGEYPVTFTVGEDSAFATIATPAGTFSLETVNAKGWIYANPAAGVLSGGGNDQMIPPTVLMD